MATVSTLSYKVAFEICSGSRDKLEEFYKNGNCNEIIMFTHYNFFYSYPEFEKQWVNKKESEFHRVETQCLACKEKPERNYAGVGSLYLLHNGISDDMILVSRKNESGNSISKYIKNTPQLTKMILLCKDHIGSYFHYGSIKPIEIQDKKNIQLSLF